MIAVWPNTGLRFVTRRESIPGGSSAASLLPKVTKRKPAFGLEVFRRWIVLKT